MIDFNKVETVLSQLSHVQENEKDQRELARQCNTFVTKIDGQWEPSVWRQWGSAQRPRYNFDRVTPIIDLIVGELEQNEFAATVSPLDGAATKETAEVIDGMIRAIQNHSGAQAKFKKVARKLVTMGFDAMRVVTDWKGGDSFQQELSIEYIPNAIDRVWFDPSSEEQDRSTAEWVVVMQALTKESYEEKFPKGNGVSVDTTRRENTYEHKRETITVGQLYWKRKKKVPIVQLQTGVVIEKDKYTDDMKLQGLTIVNEREKEVTEVITRLFDGEEWLNEEEATVFSNLPIVPFYHCFEISEDKIIWRRIVEKLMDPQRIYNYAKSRQIEEGALAPREKTWMTRAQAKGHDNQLKRMNTSTDPVQFYNPDAQAPAPYKTAPPTVNPALQTTAFDAAADIEAISGMYAANLAKNPGNQSGKAIGLQLDKGDTGNVSFYADMAIGITYLCKVLVDAIPVVHDTAESFSLIKPDGTRAEVAINTPKRGDDGIIVKENDLSIGSFSVICEMGSMFKNQLEKANAALIEVAGVMPEVLQSSADIFVRNIPAPNMNQVADRMRSQLFNAGQIPQDQWTEEEAEQMQAQQQQQMMEQQQPDAMEQAMQAQARDLNASAIEKEAKTMKTIEDAKLSAAKTQETLAKTQQTLSDIDTSQLQAVLDMRKQQEAESQQRFNNTTQIANELRTQI